MRHVAACLFAFLLPAAQASATFTFTSGNLLALDENGTNAITRTYDGLNRVTSYTEGGNTIGYRYYPSGKLAKLIYPGGTENGVGHVEYLYNSEGRLWQVIDRLDSTASPRVTTYRKHILRALGTSTLCAAACTPILALGIAAAAD